MQLARDLDALLWNQTNTMQMVRMHRPAVCAAIRSPGLQSRSRQFNTDQNGELICLD